MKKLAKKLNDLIDSVWDSHGIVKRSEYLDVVKSLFAKMEKVKELTTDLNTLKKIDLYNKEKLVRQGRESASLLESYEDLEVTLKTINNFLTEPGFNAATRLARIRNKLGLPKPKKVK